MLDRTFRLRTTPEQCPGEYVFHAYCRYDNPDHDFEEFPHIPSGAHTRRQAMTTLKRSGWQFHRDSTATCPKCSARLKREKPSLPLHQVGGER